MIRRFIGIAAAGAILATTGASAATLGVSRAGPDKTPRALSESVRLYGGIDYVESCSYDPGRKLIVLPDRGMQVREGGYNDGWISLFNPDGSVNTLKWVAADGKNAAESKAWINDPFGSDIVNNILYVGDTLQATSKDDPPTGVVTEWDLATGEMIKMIKIDGALGVNDLEVADDGTIVTTWHGTNDDPKTWQMFRIDPDGKQTMILTGPDAKRPNGVVFTPEGNIMAVNLGSNEINTYDRNGKLLKTETAPEASNDGLVMMPDGTRYVSSVSYGSLQKIDKDGKGEVLAVGIPGAASTCYDPDANQLITPTNSNAALAIYKLK